MQRTTKQGLHFWQIHDCTFDHQWNRSTHSGARGGVSVDHNSFLSGQKSTCLFLWQPLPLQHLNVQLLYSAIIPPTQSDSCFPSDKHSPAPTATSSAVSARTSAGTLPETKVLRLLENVILHGSFEIESVQSKALQQELNTTSRVASGNVWSKVHKSGTGSSQGLSLVSLSLSKRRGMRTEVSWVSY